MHQRRRGSTGSHSYKDHRTPQNQMVQHGKDLRKNYHSRDLHRKKNSRRTIGIGKDDTLFAKASGIVQFTYKGPKKRKTANVIPQ